MNHEIAWLVHNIHAKAAETIYKIVHTRQYTVEDEDFAIKLPVATLRVNLLLLQR